ncbi:MAG: AAA family ATPase, partial [Rhodocyclaceae bacterium]|nr:AAA family ATPase [Rhodocyclaceae bacterium]
MEEAGQNSVDPAAKQNAAAAAVAAPAAKPLRIKSFTLCDFRAFAGPEPVTFKLDGKNLLIYGENGAGKSSVFHALDEFFSVALTSPLERKRRLSELENIFPNIGKGNVSVRVLFEEAVDEIRWDENGHPADTKGYPVQPADPRVVKAAYRKAALDYRALLETNYRHGDGTVNLFDVCANVLLRDYPVVHNGSEWRLFDLWRRMQRLSQVLRMSYVEENEIKELSKSFNFGVAEALEALCPKVNSILKALGWVDVELTSFELGIVRFNWDRLRKNRVFLGRKITPKLRFLGKDLNKPQTFMNEARLSALALAIYFAGRQVCASTLQADTPRLMVLDDVLIGLDQSNRLPVLDVLADCFKDWQIILLTHDRTWFEMARAYQ